MRMDRIPLLRAVPGIHGRSFRVAIASLMFVGAMCSQTARSSTEVAHTSGTHRRLDGVTDFGEVKPNLFRGGQPTAEGFENLARLGIKIVVDTGRSTRDEKLITSLGMRYVSLPWYCPFPKDKVFADFLKIVKDNPDKEVFVHCRLGEDRTGMMIAAYRMAAEGWSAEDAMREMHEFGYRGIHHLMCPGLARYEKSFPRRLRDDPVFESVKTR
jgi:tyrosine-protein phosphatase SIW14